MDEELEGEIIEDGRVAAEIGKEKRMQRMQVETTMSFDTDCLIIVC